MENQIKIGTVVRLKLQNGKTYDKIDFIVARASEQYGCLLRYYSPITGKFEVYDANIYTPFDMLQPI